MLVLLVAIAGCRRNGDGRGDQATDTIAPATPAVAQDSDTAMTQTVEIGEERSPNEGGVLTDPNSPLGTETSSTTIPATDTTATGVPPKTTKSK